MIETDILHSTSIYVGSAYSNISSASYGPGFDLRNASGESLNSTFKNVPVGGSILKSTTYYTDYCFVTGLTQAEYNQYKSLTFIFSNSGNFSNNQVEIRASNPKSSNGEILAYLRFPAPTSGKSTVELPTVTSSTGYIAFWIVGLDTSYFQISGITAMSIKTPYDNWVNDYGSSITGDIKTGIKAKAADVKNLATALSYEFQRRDNYINNSAGSLASQAPTVPNIAAGGKISSSAGMDIISKILIINDYPNLKEQTQNSKILHDGRSSNLIDDVKALGQIEKTATNTGCKAACTGLCKETCYTGCGNGCSGSSKEIPVICSSGCASKCSSNCGSDCTGTCGKGCTDSCYSSCASSCSGSCSGSGCFSLCSYSCGSTCAVNCGSGCAYACVGCSGYCSGCSWSCSASCSETCDRTAKSPTSPTCSSGCAHGCLANCTNGCINLVTNGT